MAKKRIITEVSEAVHSRLKAEAAQLGIPLGSHCASILESGGSLTDSRQPSVELDTAAITSLSLGDLRSLGTSLSAKQPEDWKKKLATVNAEISRRYRS